MPIDTFNPGNGNGTIANVYTPTGDHGMSRGTAPVQQIEAAAPQAKGDTVAERAMSQIHGGGRPLRASTWQTWPDVQDRYADQHALDAQVDAFKETAAAQDDHRSRGVG